MGRAQARQAVPAHERDDALAPRSAGGWSTPRCPTSGPCRSARAPRSSPTGTGSRASSRTSSRSTATRRRPPRGTAARSPTRSSRWRSSSATRTSAPTRTLEKLGQLKPVFRKDGTVTAGNSSPMNDGASALLLSGERGRRAGADRQPRVERRRAAALRHRAGRGGEQGARARGHRLGRPDGGRAQRGVRRAVARLPGRVEGARPGDRQRQRRRDRARPRARQLGHAAADHARARAQAARRRLGPGDDVHRRRTGGRDGDRGMNGYRRDDRRHAPGVPHARVRARRRGGRPTSR